VPPNHVAVIAMPDGLEEALSVGAVKVGLTMTSAGLEVEIKSVRGGSVTVAQ